MQILLPIAIAKRESGQIQFVHSLYVNEHSGRVTEEKRDDGRDLKHASDRTQAHDQRFHQIMNQQRARQLFLAIDHWGQMCIPALHIPHHLHRGLQVSRHFGRRGRKTDHHLK